MASLSTAFRRVSTFHPRPLIPGPSSPRASHMAFSSSASRQVDAPAAQEKFAGLHQPLVKALKDAPVDQQPKPSVMSQLTSKEYSGGPRNSMANLAFTPFPNDQRFIRPSDFSLKGRRPRVNRRVPWELGPDKKEALNLDVFHKLDIDPLNEATNSSIMSHYVSSLGKILTRAETSLTWKSQRRLGKAIRRAKMMGIIPHLSRRPLKINRPLQT